MQNKFNTLPVISILLILTIIVTVHCAGSVAESPKTLVILTLNDLHGQFEAMQDDSGSVDTMHDHEIGGLARIATTIKKIRTEYSESIPIISTGGITSPSDVWELLGVGADALGVLTGFITNGPFFFKHLCEELVREMNVNDYDSFEEVKGHELKP